MNFYQTFSLEATFRWGKGWRFTVLFYLYWGITLTETDR